MKKIILATILLITIACNAQEKGTINWISLEEATKLQEKTPKKIILDMYTTWCGPCKMLDKNTFQNKDVADYINKNYYAVKFNAEGNKDVTFKGEKYSNPGYDPAKKGGRNSSHQFSQYLRVNAYPTVVFLDEKADLITPIPGYRDPQGMEILLKLFATNKYKEVTTREQFLEYQKNFKHEFKK